MYKTSNKDISIVEETLFHINGHTFSSLKEAYDYFKDDIKYHQSLISNCHTMLAKLHAKYEDILRKDALEFKEPLEVTHNYFKVTIENPYEIKSFLKKETIARIRSGVKSLEELKNVYYTSISLLKELEKRLDAQEHS